MYNRYVFQKCVHQQHHLTKPIAEHSHIVQRAGNNVPGKYHLRDSCLSLSFFPSVLLTVRYNNEPITNDGGRNVEALLPSLGAP